MTGGGVAIIGKVGNSGSGGREIDGNKIGEGVSEGGGLADGEMEDVLGIAVGDGEINGWVEVS